MLLSDISVGSFTGGPVGDVGTNYYAMINWGDGSTDTVFTQSTSGTITNQSHTYTASGNYTPVVKVKDATGQSGSASFAIAALVPPVVTAPSNQSTVPGVSASFSLGSFSEFDSAQVALGPWSVDIKWGDGSTDTKFTLPATGTITAQSHTYASGTFAPVIKVSLPVCKAGGIRTWLELKLDAVTQPRWLHEHRRAACREDRARDPPPGPEIVGASPKSSVTV